MGISSMSIIANVAVLIFHHRNVKIQKPMPRWVSFFVIIQSYYICYRTKHRMLSKEAERLKHAQLLIFIVNATAIRFFEYFSHHKVAIFF
jgi:hypothetical protein